MIIIYVMLYSSWYWKNNIAKQKIFKIGKKYDLEGLGNIINVMKINIEKLK